MKALRFIQIALIGILIGLCLMQILSIPFLLLGLFTGQIAMCASGPEWWAKTYWALGNGLWVISFVAGQVWAFHRLGGHINSQQKLSVEKLFRKTT